MSGKTTCSYIRTVTNFQGQRFCNFSNYMMAGLNPWLFSTSGLFTGFFGKLREKSTVPTPGPSPAWWVYTLAIIVEKQDGASSSKFPNYKVINSFFLAKSVLKLIIITYFYTLKVTIDVLRDIYKNDSSLIRRGLYYKTQDDVKPAVENLTAKGLSIEQMSVIDAGWHCSWCFKPQGIRAKLLDAPNSDFPRFGDVIFNTYLSTCAHTYILKADKFKLSSIL